LPVSGHNLPNSSLLIPEGHFHIIKVILFTTGVAIIVHKKEELILGGKGFAE